MHPIQARRSAAVATVRTRTALTLCLVLALLVGLAPAGQAANPRRDVTPPGLQPRSVPDQPQRASVPPDHARDRLHLKFVEGSSVRLRGGRFVSTGDDDMSELHEALRRHPGVRPERLFRRAEAQLEREKGRIEEQSRREQADKNLWYRLRLGRNTDPVALIEDLHGVALVEIAYAEPLPAPPPSSHTTPDFTADQHYARPSAEGIDADYAWTIPGGRGGNVRIIDIEYDWNFTHEDLSKAAGALIANGTPSSPFDDDHGTAVIGQLIADDNDFGVTGLVPDAALRLVNEFNDENGSDRANAIDLAHANMSPGDVMLLEMQTPGPNGCDNGVSGCVAVEWVQALYDAIVAATSDGITVVQAAGNGGENLNDADTYGSPFPDGRADSGAIIVGSGGVDGCTHPQRGRRSSSTFGTRVNLQGSGECVTTTGYGFLQGGADRNRWYTDRFGGTSSASPIVAAAAAAVSSVAQQQGVPMTPVGVRSLLVATGTPQNTAEGTLSGNIGPQPNLKAALMAFVPTADPGGPYSTDEGTDIVLDATGSSDPQGDALTYEWDFTGNGVFNDATGPTPTFDLVGFRGVHTIALRVTDSHGASDVATTIVIVFNVAPSVDSLATTAPASVHTPENSLVTVSGLISDPGWLTSLTATIDWADGNGPQPLPGTLENTRPDATLTFSTPLVYGDTGTFPVEVCGSDGVLTTCDSIDVVIANVDPTATIDTTDTTLFNGVATFLAASGEPLPISGRAQDPGSDDLELRWTWGDATPDEVRLQHVNPPGDDPPLSPTVQPRDVTDTAEHTYGDACLYDFTFTATDDDGGVGTDSAPVLIVGLADLVRTAGYWQSQYRGVGTREFSDATLQCYLDVAGHVSQVFHGVVDASTIDQAREILHLKGKSTPVEQLDRQLLSALLNFANGAVALDELVDTTGDGVPDTTYADMIAAAEAVRLDATADAFQLETQKNILERFNLRDS